MKTKLFLLTFMSLFLSLGAFAQTYSITSPGTYGCDSYKINQSGGLL